LTFGSSTTIGVGSTVDVYIDLTAVTNLCGFQVNYDSTRVGATAVFDNSFFDTS
jgi:hypothetical protein